MDILKKYWYIGLILIGTLSLGLTSLIISTRLQQREQVAPSEPRAAAPACTLSFSIVDGPTPTNTSTPTPPPATCNQSCTTFTNCGDGLTCVEGRCRISACTGESSCICPTSTPTSSPRPTNTPAPGTCNAGCNQNADCANNFVCAQGTCRNPQCTEQSNCACYFVPTPKVPVTGTGTTLLGISVIGGGIILLLLGLAF